MDFLKIGQKGEGGFKFFFNKGRDRKKGWDGVITGDKENLQNFFNFLKGILRHIELNPTNTASLLQEATQKYRRNTD